MMRVSDALNVLSGADWADWKQAARILMRVRCGGRIRRDMRGRSEDV